MNTINKEDIITGMAYITGKSEFEAREMFEAMLTCMKAAMKNGSNIQFRGFGSFRIATRKSRSVRNINTGVQYIIGETKRIVFEPGKDLKM